MDLVDGTEHFEDKVTDQSPSLLIIILDTNPLAWSLLENTLSLASAVSNLLVFINAHLACNYTNKVAVIASHCDKAQWLYPSPISQLPPRSDTAKASTAQNETDDLDENGPASKRRKHRHDDLSPTSHFTSGNKYRPFRLIEAEVITNLTKLLQSTSPDTLKQSNSTQIAGALTLALSYINRLYQNYDTSILGDQGSTGPDTSSNNRLQSRIFLLSSSPSTDLAVQYIAIMNAIFACQRLNIPIDILQIPLSTPTTNTTSSSSAPSTDTASPTVFLQQASDATSGIYIPFQFPTSPTAKPTDSGPNPDTLPISTVTSQALLTYLLTSFLPSPSTRLYLTPPTLINVDFRAACFCHRRVIDLGYVCSICLSIFCAPPEDGVCLTCGNKLTLGAYGKKPVVVAARKKVKKKKRPADSGSGIGTPVQS